MSGPTPLPAVASVVLAAIALGLPVTDQAARDEVDRLAVAVSAARHLPFHGTIAARVATRAEMRAQLASAIASGSADPAAGAAGARFLRRLGLIPADTGYEKLALAAYGASLAPTYDPTTRRLLIPSFLSLEAQRLPLAHEVAHAVLDQRFGIRRLLEIGPDGSHHLDGDTERARLALIEGDATLSAIELVDPREEFLDGRALGALAAELARAAGDPAQPAWFSTLERFEHVDGLTFVAGVRAQRPWSAVDALWTDPPASTAQVLHPEKYEACALPLAVGEDLLPALPGVGRPEASDVLGELVVRAWLAAALPPEVAERAAAGWAGDRAGIYAPPPPHDRDAASEGDRADGAVARPRPDPLAWLTVWDDPAEAEDFARAAAAIGVHHLARRGEAVALLLGPPGDDAPAALDAMLEGWQRQQQAAARKAGRRRPGLSDVSRPEGARPRPAAQPGCPRRDPEGAPR